jgi:hypothetical protein
MYKEVFMAEISSDFLEAFGLTQSDVDEVNNVSGDNTDANPDAQTLNNQQATDTTDVQEGQAADTTSNDAQTQQEPSTAQQDNAQPQQTPNRANAAFAQMRSENTALKRIVNDIAGVLGIDTNTPQAQMQAAVQDAILKAQARQQNMDPALLRRITHLEQYKEANEKQALTNRALMGFQTVKNQFNLTDAEVDDFADQLIMSGVNPFVRELDLVAEYKIRNFDALIAAAEARGKEQEASRAQAVAAHSTQPGTASGKGAGTEPDKISSVSELTNWFDKNTK